MTTRIRLNLSRTRMVEQVSLSIDVLGDPLRPAREYASKRAVGKLASESRIAIPRDQSLSSPNGTDRKCRLSSPRSFDHDD